MRLFQDRRRPEVLVEYRGVKRVGNRPYVVLRLGPVDLLMRPDKLLRDFRPAV